MARRKDVLETAREDDYVEYYIFPDLSKEDDDVKERLGHILTSVMAIVDKYGSTYIWQKDDVNLLPRCDCGLPPVDESVEKLPPHLYGVTHFGDNIEDEWFIVYLLLKATAEIPGAVIRVADSDGEFLLIEAAEQLPNWANPENCGNRVYMYNGSVHLVRIDHQPKIEVGQAVSMVRFQPSVTIASPEIQAAISTRISGYPERIAENQHSCNVFVPVRVAALLKARPSLIAAAVTAFCHRDPLDVKACRAMRHFPPEQCVLTRVVFTKCLYAMLTHQKYAPDRCTGWKLPPATDAAYAATILGVKLACGFEILVSQIKSCGETNDWSKDWQRYKQSLINKGYFKNLLEGSQEYTRLEHGAREYFQNHCVQSQPGAGQLIVDLLQDLTVDVDELRSLAANLPPPDDDSWLDVSQTELDEMLEQRYGCKPTHNSTDISARLADFLNHVSTVNGAEFPQDGESPPVRPRRGIKPRKEAVAQDNEEDDNRVSFDQEAFSCAIQNILDFVVPEDNWDMESEGSGMSSYEDEGDMDLGKKSGEQSETPISELKQYMDQMDRELSSTAVGKSFEKVQTSASNQVMEESFSEVENFEPVDIDMNALKNILESYQAQMGAAGPASNLLGPMGVRLESTKE